MTPDKMWAAVVGNDARHDWQFVYAVTTTGIYCRPSCGARCPNRKNVEFYRSAADASNAGYRPCKRCRPNGDGIGEQHAAMAEKACRAIEQSESPLSLGELAIAAGSSPSHFQRVFKKTVGVTPKAYASAIRDRRVRDNLRNQLSVTDAIYESGFGSTGRFYATATEKLGMTPSTVKSGGNGEQIRFAVGECTLGSVLVAASAAGICAIFLGDEPEPLVQELQDRFPKATLVGADEGFDSWVARVIGSIEAPHTGLNLPLDIRGTAFQQRVWNALTEIPIGSTSTYSKIAARLGSPTASRAVAGACAANKIGVAIPCHRVIRQDGAISGYRWGVERKKKLLARERGETSES